jgi:hypothetical protein
MKTKKPKVKTRSAIKPPASLLFALLRAAVISLGCGLILLLLLCAVLLSTDDPGAYAQTVGTLLPFPIAILCGVLSAKPGGGLHSCDRPASFSLCDRGGRFWFHDPCLYHQSKYG